MSARSETFELMHRFSNRGINLSFDDANTLRRAELALQHWGELECGNSNDYGSWAIERDEQTDIPYMVRHHYRHGQGKDTVSRYRIPDKEKGALARVRAICERNGLHYYHQSDPRGCTLYVSAEPFQEFDYTRGIACCV